MKFCFIYGLAFLRYSDEFARIVDNLPIIHCAFINGFMCYFFYYESLELYELIRIMEKKYKMPVIKSSKLIITDPNKIETIKSMLYSHYY